MFWARAPPRWVSVHVFCWFLCMRHFPSTSTISNPTRVQRHLCLEWSLWGPRGGLASFYLRLRKCGPHGRMSEVKVKVMEKAEACAPAPALVGHHPSPSRVPPPP